MVLNSRRLRSRLSWQILRILAFKVAGPVLAAELIEFIRASVAATHSLSRFVHVVTGPKGFLYVYLRRLAEADLIEIRGAHKRREVLLTRKGRAALEDLAGKKDADMPYESPELEEKEFLERIEPLPDELPIQRMLKEKRMAWSRRCSRDEGAVFLSYDIPEKWVTRRNWLRERLQGLGFERFHRSFYLGHPRQIRRVIEEAETWGLVPYLCWGNLKVLPG